MEVNHDKMTTLQTVIDTLCTHIDEARREAVGRVLQDMTGNCPSLLELEIIQAHDWTSRPEISSTDLLSLLKRLQGDNAKRTTVLEAITRSDFIDRRPEPGARHSMVFLTQAGKRFAFALRDIARFMVPRLFGANEFPSREGSGRKVVDMLLTCVESFKASESQSSPVKMVHGANQARVYATLLGEKHWTAADRYVAGELDVLFPYAQQAALANRAFVRRVTRFMAENKVHQFLDLGSGLSFGCDSVHGIASAITNQAKTVYLDSDMFVTAIGRTVLADTPAANVAHCNIGNPDDVIAVAEQHGIDFSFPVGVLAAASLHFLTDIRDVNVTVEHIKSRLEKRSFIAISHGHFPEGYVAEMQADAVLALWNSIFGAAKMRSRDEILAFFDGMRLVPHAAESQRSSGLVFVPEWRPDIPDMHLFGEPPPLADSPAHSLMLAGVGKKS